MKNRNTLGIAGLGMLGAVAAGLGITRETPEPEPEPKPKRKTPIRRTELPPNLTPFLGPTEVEKERMAKAEAKRKRKAAKRLADHQADMDTREWIAKKQREQSDDS